jgi:hypothetical protein
MQHQVSSLLTLQSREMQIKQMHPKKNQKQQPPPPSPQNAVNL